MHGRWQPQQHPPSITAFLVFGILVILPPMEKPMFEKLSGAPIAEV